MCSVEWKKLGDVCEVGTGNNNREDACENGLYPFYVRSKDILRINKYLFNEEAVIIPGEGGIGDIFHYANGKYGLHQRAYRVHPTNKELICKFVYYYLSDKFKQYIISKSVGATATSIRKPMLEGFMLPIPSLAKQQEIVSHLDTFTTLISNLESELDMRRKQYEHYRNQLLDFEGVEGVEWKTLGDIAPYRKVRIEHSLLNVHNYVSVENLLQMKKGKVDAEKVPLDGNAIKYEMGDILVGNIRPYLKKIWLAEYEGGTNGDVLVFGIKDKNKLISKYLFYLLSSDAFFDYDNQHAKGGKMPRGDKSMIEKYLIPIPSSETQQEIVEKLDAFEQLIQSLETEIKLRKQQYEYYREKLLTFE